METCSSAKCRKEAHYLAKAVATSLTFYKHMTNARPSLLNTSRGTWAASSREVTDERIRNLFFILCWHDETEFSSHVWYNNSCINRLMLSSHQTVEEWSWKTKKTRYQDIIIKTNNNYRVKEFHFLQSFWAHAFYNKRTVPCQAGMIEKHSGVLK